MIFDNFTDIRKGGKYGIRKAPKKEFTFLQGNKRMTEERVGDYLGTKIPSLLEFFENKIHLRNTMGISHFPKSLNGPKIIPHKMPKSLI